MLCLRLLLLESAQSHGSHLQSITTQAFTVYKAPIALIEGVSLRKAILILDSELKVSFSN